MRTGCLSLALALLAALAGGCGGHATGVWRPPRECSFAQVANDLALSPGAFRVLFDPKVPAGTGSIHCEAELDGGSARTAVISAYQLHLGGGGLQGEAEVLLPVPEGVSGSRALTCTVSYAAEAGEHTSSHAFAVRVERRLEAPAHEFRAAWTHISKTPDPDDLFSRMAAGGLNAVFLRVRRGETAYYNSSVGPLCLIPYGNPRQLEDCIAAAERHGIDLHVYVNCFNLGQPYSAFAGQLRREGRWQRSARGQDLPWLCPADAANVEIVKQGVLELVRDYPVKGIQYDFIRYPDEDACYCSRCRAAFEEHIGEPVANWPADVRPGGPLEEEYLEVRAGHITRAVRDITAAIRAIRSEVVISAAVHARVAQPGVARDVYGQDWSRWVEEGLIDALCPMSYLSETAAYEHVVRTVLTDVGGAVPVYAGIRVRRVSGEVYMRYPEQLAAQLNITRRLGAAGFSLFCMNPPTGVPETLLVPLRDSLLAGDGRG